MDVTILEDRRGSAQSRTTRLLLGFGVPALGLTLVVLLQKMAGRMFIPWWLWFVIAIITYGIVLAISVTTERPTQVATRGPETWGQVYTNAPPDAARWALSNALGHRKVRPTGQVGPTMLGRRSMSFWSWGSQVAWDLRPSSDRPGLGVVTVCAKPHSPIQVTEWGKGVALVTEVLQSVPGVVAYRDAEDPTQVRPVPQPNLGYRP